jgi:hypothetical protein
MIGELDAGNLHVQFDEGTLETGGDVPRLRPTLRPAGACISPLTPELKWEDQQDRRWRV